MESLGYEPYVFAIGVVDRFGIITSVSNDVSEVIGVTADEVLGHSLLPLDKEEFWSRLHSSTDPRTVLSISLPYRAGASGSDDAAVHCLLADMAGSDNSCFVLLPDNPSQSLSSSNRTGELEHHLLRIAARLSERCDRWNGKHPRSSALPANE